MLLKSNRISKFHIKTEKPLNWSSTSTLQQRLQPVTLPQLVLCLQTSSMSNNDLISNIENNNHNNNDRFGFDSIRKQKHMIIGF